MKIKNIMFCTLTSVFLVGCASNNVQPYKVDTTDFLDFKNRVQNKVNINKVTMPNGDSDSIMCRMVGNIYLPGKMKYSEYIHQAINKALVVTDRLGCDDKTSNFLSLELTKVDFSSLSGEWAIEGYLTIKNGNPIAVKSTTHYGTSWDAGSACRNAADSFPDAVTNFVKKVLSYLT